MKSILLTLCFMIGAIGTHGQAFNMVMESNWDNNSLPTSGGLAYNDCWGYNAPNGTEVAIIGTLQRIYFFDVTDPTNPEIIDFFTVQNSNGTTNNSIWRDFKTYDHYCYASADQGTSGLLIFDLQDVPENVVLVDQTQEFFIRSHNIWIDVDHGRLYTAGGSNTTGTTILDIATDPEDPTELAEITLPFGYIHDIHVVDHIGYASHGSDQALVIYDFEDPDNIVELNTLDLYPEPGYNHSAWLDASGTRLVFCDETHGKSVKLVDPTIFEPSTTDYHLFKSQLLENNSNSIAHNPFIKGDLCFVAYYHDGVQVFDISDPEDINRIAYYDTYSNTTYSGYDGCWGVYPFLESGNIIGSDTENGLFMLSLSDVLPLEFIAFDAIEKPSGVELQWKVSGPQDEERFFVEHSADGKIFDRIHELNSEKHIRTYAAVHDDPGPGLHFYRISMRYRDGNVTSTSVRTVHIESHTPFTLKTRFVEDRILVDVNSAGSIHLIGTDGKHLLSRQIPDAQRIEMNMRDYPAGLYFVLFRSVSGDYTGSVVKP